MGRGCQRNPQHSVIGAWRSPETALFQVLFVFIVIQHDRRRLMHFNVPAHPRAEWSVRQIIEAFPFETVPNSFLRLLSMFANQVDG